MKRIVLALTLALAFSMVAFAQETATIWFYRIVEDRSDLNPTIYLGVPSFSRRLASLKPGEFFGIQLPSGVHAFSWTRAPSRGQAVAIPVASGQQAFVSVTFQSVTLVSADQALADMKGLRPSGDIFDAAVIAPALALQTPRIQPAALPLSTSATLRGRDATAQLSPGRPVRQADTLPGFPDDLRRVEFAWVPVGYARADASNYVFGDLSFTVNVNRFFGIVSDVSDHVLVEDTSLDVLTYRFGPRFSAHPNHRLTTFGQIVAGGAQVNVTETTKVGNASFTSIGTVNGLSFAAGGGLDLNIRRWFALRLVQADYNFLRFNGENRNGFRIAPGIVFHTQ